MIGLRRALRIFLPIAAAYAAIARLATRLLGGPSSVGDVVIGPLHNDTTLDPSGAARSVQSVDLRMPTAALAAIWTPMHLERLARTYWRFLSRCTLGLVRVEYTETERFVVLGGRPLTLLAFGRPEYAMNEREGVVRWNIERGVLVARRGIEADGHLEIFVRRTPTDDPARTDLHIEIEVANYYPRIASALTQWAYAATQSRIHVLVTYGFLRSLAALDLAESKVGSLVNITDVPSPTGPAPSERAAGAGRLAA
ncbi:unannotated protein [freshwater metagenome]|uniref:Unannotated protein n=1 Tax=freshwater metagenome TaxID=449393 RepID=A0A6J7D346_9ZZZZ|nr:hypothetical protein [Actinomycetota bacterium]